MSPKVELVKTYRRINGEQQLAWTFDRDRVPLGLGDVPIDLWHKTCDRVVAVHDERQKQHETVARRRDQTILLVTYPPMIFFWAGFAKSMDDDDDRLFLWKAWMATVLGTSIMMVVSWLVMKYYIYPQYLSLEDCWKFLAGELQREYRRHGVAVQVKRVPALFPFLVKILPDGLVSCGIVLEPQTADDARVVSPEIEANSEGEIIPTLLSSKGIPAGTWDTTLHECKALHENQIGRIKSSLQLRENLMKWLLIFDFLFFMTAPFFAWSFKMTSNTEVNYVGWAFLGLLTLGFLFMWSISQMCSNTRAVFNQCSEEWEALATRTKSVYAPYDVIVSTQNRGRPFRNSSVAMKRLLSIAPGLNNPDRAVGLSLQTNDGAVVNIEYGQVVLVATEEKIYGEEEVEQAPLVSSELV